MWITRLVGASWFPYALIGGVAAVGIVFGLGYLKGYNKAEQTGLKVMNKALAEQLVEVLAQKELELRLAVQAEAKKHDIAKKISMVPKPASSCVLEPECLRWYDNILRAATTRGLEPD